METNITPKKPNIRVPEGFELRISPYSGNWALFPIEGFSKKYLRKNHFVPSRGVNTDASEVIVKGKTKNSNLHKAKRNKNDEFYTRLDDIVCELKYYKEHFKDKIVYCPCDKCFNDGRSKFFDYCAMNFKDLGLKAVIATQYNPNGHGTIKTITAETISELESRGIKWTWHGENGGISSPDESEIPTEFLEGDGSFDSPECRKIMKECDIVVTNPPFSKTCFRPFVKQIMDFGKKFLIIAPINAITYKDIFCYIKENRLWLGYTSPKIFEIPIDKIEDEKKQFEDDGKIYQTFGNICWFTNLEHRKRKEPLYIWKEYTPDEYPLLENIDNAIDIGHYISSGKWQGCVNLIPKDYDGIMAVPITFLDNYCPDQFEIIGSPDADIIPAGWHGMNQKFVDLYYEQGNTGTYKEGNRLAHIVKDGRAIVTYKRILIRRKQK